LSSPFAKYLKSKQMEEEEFPLLSSVKVSRKMTTRGPVFELTIYSSSPVGEEDKLVTRVVNLLKQLLEEMKYAHKEDKKNDY